MYPAHLDFLLYLAFLTRPNVPWRFAVRLRNANLAPPTRTILRYLIGYSGTSISSFTIPDLLGHTGDLLLTLILWVGFLLVYLLHLAASPSTELLVLTLFGHRPIEGNLRGYSQYLYRYLRQSLTFYVVNPCWHRQVRPSLNFLVRIALLIPLPRTFPCDVRYWSSSRSTLHTTWTLRISLSPKPATKRGKHRSRRHHGTYLRLHLGPSLRPQGQDSSGSRPKPKWTKRRRRSRYFGPSRAYLTTARHTFNLATGEFDSPPPTMDRLRTERATSSAIDRTLKAFPPLEQFRHEMGLRGGFLTSISKQQGLLNAYNATADLLHETHIKLHPKPSTESLVYLEQHTSRHDLPIIFDTGCSCSLTPVRDDFVSPLDDTTCKEMKGLSDSVPIQGIGWVEWTVRFVPKPITFLTQPFACSALNHTFRRTIHPRLT